MICYLSGGFPTMEKCLEAAEHYAAAGCDAIEWSFPADHPHREADHITEMMRTAKAECADYRHYMDSIRQFRQKNSEIEIMLMLYEEVVTEIGARLLAAFCQEVNIDTVITADIRSPEMIRELETQGICIAPFVSFQMEPEMLDAAVRSKRFIYVQAMPGRGDTALEAPEKILRHCIRTLRERGVDQPIYCGGGIRSPEELERIKEAGADGFFLGSSIMQYYDEPERMKALIREYRLAAG